MRSIFHVDMDAFYASVEQRDNPLYRNRPLVVGHPAGKRGVVSSASYEAREYGIRSAMPVREAYRRCPEAVFVAPDMEKYSSVSREVMEILESFSPQMEQLSVDEAFLDMTGTEKLFGSSAEAAGLIRKTIREKTGLNASVGISYNKFLAKTATDMCKPDGVLILTPDNFMDYLRDLPVEKVYGIGRKTGYALRKTGIDTAGKLAAAEPSSLRGILGSRSEALVGFARGEDDRDVTAKKGPGQMGGEITFSEDLDDPGKIVAALRDICSKTGARLRQGGYRAKTLVLKIRYADFSDMTRSRTFIRPTARDEDLAETASELFLENYDRKRKVRLAGIYASGLIGKETPEQLVLFGGEEDKKDRMYSVVDEINSKYGNETIRHGFFPVEQKKRK